VQLKGLSLNDNGVSGIDTPLVTYYDICRPTEQISDFTFSFIAPLGTDYYDVSQGFFKMLYFHNLQLLAWGVTGVNFQPEL
jgi:hypothetical protein